MSIWAKAEEKSQKVKKPKSQKRRLETGDRRLEKCLVDMLLSALSFM
jgi:hypothetical protein